jgi:hypothetical protein
MDPRRILSLLFLSTLPLVAQGQTPDPDRPAPTQAEELAKLEREKERLLREIDYVKNRVSNAKDLLTRKFAKRTLSVREIDAGRSNMAQPATPPTAPRHARLMQEDELNSHPADVMMLVGGNPVTRQAFDALVAHQSDKIAPEMRGQMALYELIRIEGAAAEFTEGEVEGVLSEVATKLAAGQSVAELAPTYGILAGSAEDGRIEVTRNSRFGPRLEQIAFELEDGATSRPFRHHAGVVVLHRDSLEKGASPELDKVVAHALHIPYTNEPEQLLKVQRAISTAQIEIVVRDKETMMLLPIVFRDAEYMPKPQPDGAGNLEVLQKTLEALKAEIKSAEASDNEVDKGRLPMLQSRFERLQKEIDGLTEQLRAEQGTDEVPQDEMSRRPVKK